MNVLFIVDGPSYGSELHSNALRLATTLAERDLDAERVITF